MVKRASHSEVKILMSSKVKFVQRNTATYNNRCCLYKNLKSFPQTLELFTFYYKYHKVLYCLQCPINKGIAGIFIIQNNV